MRYADLLQLKPVQVVLFIAVLVGAFVLGKCLMPKPLEETSPVLLPLPETKKEEGVQAVAKEEIRFDEQCRDVRLDAQCSLLPPFLLRKCSTTASPEETFPVLFSFSEPAKQEKMQVVAGGEVRFDEQCQDVRLDAQCSLLPLFLPEGGWGMIIYAELEQQERLAPPIVLLKPLRKKRRIAQPGRSVQEYSPVLFGKNVLLKPLRKKQRIALPKKSVQKYPSDIFGADGQSACTGGVMPAVLTTVASLEARSIRYGTGPLSDCSGIFHRVLMGVKKRCPDHNYPSLKRYRDSRDLVRWYREQGELIWIKDALKRTDVIRPGMVMFYGRRGSVRHVGVVVSVARDKNGKVVSYKLFHGHGRRGRTAASTTNWHKRNPDRASYPPFGNGQQQLIAAARIVRPVKAKKKTKKER
ncbi:MAG: hypothetical protein D3910_12610 [Candidatus Electrothrix sp. ATG2]|nr:hypothetical protein [Candidatus Electrothrix sp. ATG2]